MKPIFSKLWAGLTLCSCVLLAELLLPTAIVLIVAALLYLVGQSQEILYGLVGFDPASREIDFWPVFMLVLSTFILSLVIWYSSRMLLTSGGGVCSQWASRGEQYARSLKLARETLPRLLGSLCATLVAIAFAKAQARPDLDPRYVVVWAVIGTLMPLAFIHYFIRHTPPEFLRRTRDEPSRLKRLLILAPPVSLFLVLVLLPASRIESNQGIVWAYFGWIFAVFAQPALLYAFTILRRRWLELNGYSSILSCEQGALRLGAAILFCVLILAPMALLPSGWITSIGSSAIVLLFSASATAALTAITILLRFLDLRWPGVAAVILALTIAVFLLLSSEKFGEEKLSPTQELVVAHPQKVDPLGSQVIVNAYGGGIRAALFTAALLANLDDRTCGRFGTHLKAMSGVSGGSLGIATYLVLRQEFIASGGWPDSCDSARPQRFLSNWVNAALVRDHLSAALSRMLSSDIWTSEPTRGEALLKSWGDALQRASTPKESTFLLNGAHATLSMPISKLTGGLEPAPQVYFNTTDTMTGHRLWVSNTGEWNEGDKSPKPLPPDMQLGLAILNSARFPAISPAGIFRAADGSQQVVVDGGYADNSGTATLLERLDSSTNIVWIDIYGNPVAPACQQYEEQDAKSKAKQSRLWSAVHALLSVQDSQADLAVERLDVKLSTSNHIVVSIDLEKALSFIPDETLRCSAVRRMREAPLGWYLTPNTAYGVEMSASDESNLVCNSSKGLCDSAKGM